MSEWRRVSDRPPRNKWTFIFRRHKLVHSELGRATVSVIKRFAMALACQPAVRAKLEFGKYRQPEILVLDLMDKVM